MSIRDRLYYIQSLIKIVQERGEKYLLVKWAHYIYPTKEPLQKFRKQNPTFEEEIQKLQAEAEARKVGVDLKQEIKIELQRYMTTLYGTEQHHFEVNPPRKTARKITAEEKRRAKQKAKRQMIRRNNLGLRDLGAKDYLYFMKLLYKLEEQVKYKLRSDSLPKSQCVVNEVTGIYRHEQSFRYCVQIDSQVFACSLQEMIEHCPAHLVEYLRNLTDFMKEHLAEEIKDYNHYGKASLAKHHAARQVDQTIAVTQKFHQLEDIWFGVTNQDALLRKEECQSLKERQFLEGNTKNKDEIVIQQLRNLYEEVRKQLEDNVEEDHSRQPRRLSQNISDRKTRRRGQVDEHEELGYTTPRRRRSRGSSINKSEGRQQSEGKRRKKKRNTKKEGKRQDYESRSPLSRQSQGESSGEGLRRSNRLRQKSGSIVELSKHDQSKL